ncbi:HPF/RaiA family ribosome-associated protein [Variovorax sp. J22R133]|uniref:HPF/RaiA family ribosome-associated protein n=1 Tax=Variovorax brevis TaxID=3053503 RepID=UPI0025783C4C|nr:HPF/RaiA family ribosome-associated protein [Variovorax sp. J22R133]MDM0113367.1 HPF/RaiA family ribosome-associated protein [Variovorax sp. J22R133]
MQVQVNASNGIDNKETLEKWADGEIRHALGRFGNDITRVEIHLSGETGDKGGASDKRCTMEARLAQFAPVAVTHHAPGIDEAFRGAADKLKHLLDSKLGRLTDHRARESIRGAEMAGPED